MKMKLFLLIITSLMLVIWQSIGTSASKDLVAAWTLDEGFGGKVKNASGNGHNGVISGTKWVKGKFGGLRWNSMEMVTKFSWRTMMP